MRLDRFITLSVVRPLRSTLARSSASPQGAEQGREVLPVLMYHSISDREESHLSDYYKVCTAPAQFRLHMQTLKEHGYLGVDLETGLDWLNAPPSSPLRKTELAGLRDGELKLTSPPSPPRGEGRGEVPDSASRLPPPATSRLQPVAITFDDGFRDFYTEALPVLVGHGFAATMYLPTAFIGETRRSFAPRRLPHAVRPTPSPECMTWAEVLESQANGICFGSHTRTHPKLYELSWPEIESELNDSRAEMEAQLGKPVTSFAYPYAFPQSDHDFSKRFVDTMAKSGYRSAVTTIIGRVFPGDDVFLVKRHPVNSCDDEVFLRAKLEGGYDWVSLIQRAVKSLKFFSRQRSSSLG